MMLFVVALNAEYLERSRIAQYLLEYMINNSIPVAYPFGMVHVYLNFFAFGN